LFLESDSHIQGLGAFLACTKRKFNLLSFVQRLVAFSTNGREMYEDIFSTFAFNEAKAFVVVEPFYGSVPVNRSDIRTTPSCWKL